MIVYEYSSKPPFRCSIKFEKKDVETDQEVLHVNKVMVYFNGRIISLVENKLTYEFNSEQDMFSFGRFVFDNNFDPETYQPFWIVKSPNLPDASFTDCYSAMQEYEQRVDQGITVQVIGPSFDRRIA